MRLRVLAARDIGRVFVDALETQHIAGEDEGVAGRKLLDEIFLELAEHAPAAAGRPAFGLQADIDHRVFDDDADIEAVLLRDLGMGDAPQPFRRLAQPRIAVVALERIAAGRDEIEHAVEIRAREMTIGRCR